ncbi:MAG: phosphoglycerate kinase [Proteobacteria bacterium]|nr:phosphoglycerate kinase [Pseudomonadota bacterium]
MKTIKDIDISGKKVFIRVDFNVPMDDKQNITEDTRIRTVLPTLNYALSQNSKIILASHLGRPKGKVVPSMSLKPVAAYLSKLIGKDVKIAPDCIGPEVKDMISTMKEGDIILLENLRYHEAEQKNNPEFAKELALLCDVYINNAFAVSHRAHASVAAITEYATTSAAGLLLAKEIDFYKKAMETPKRPLVAIVGGAKVSSKLEALENMLKHVDRVIIGGAMANTFLKSQGHDVGASMVEDDLLETAKKIVSQAKEKGISFHLPVDVVASDKFEADSPNKVTSVTDIPKGSMALDIGPDTVADYSKALDNAGTIVWNGPMGVFEMPAFSQGTLAIAKKVAQSPALTIVGGGDTDAAVHAAGVADKMSYISTGGGAFLMLMEGKTLPGVDCLEKAEKK